MDGKYLTMILTIFCLVFVIPASTADNFTDTPEITTEPTIISSFVEQAELPTDQYMYYEIETSPTGADVIFDGNQMGTAPVTVPSSESSSHTIVASLDGYEEQTITVTDKLTPGETKIVMITLVKNAGDTIKTGGEQQETPPPNTVLPVIQTTETSTKSMPGPIPNPGDIGSLNVVTSPPGAGVIIDGTTIGMTPLRSTLYTGTYVLTLVHPDFLPISQFITINPGEETRINTTLTKRKPPVGNLKVNSNPSSGIVTLDSVQKGQTPVMIKNLYPGSYMLRISVPGQNYLDWIGFAKIEAGKTTTIDAILPLKKSAQNTGYLMIESTPSEADVYVDGVYQGTTPIHLAELITGTHEVKISFSGYESSVITVNIRSGETATISANLNRGGIVDRSNLVRLSDDAAVYFKSNGRTEAIAAYSDKDAGFNRDGVYIVAMDLNGTIISNSAHPETIGKNILEMADIGGVYSGRLMIELAKSGGGFLYDLLLSGNSNKVSLVYARPPLSGVVIAAVEAEPKIMVPDVPVERKQMQEMVTTTIRGRTTANFVQSIYLHEFSFISGIPTISPASTITPISSSPESNEIMMMSDSVINTSELMSIAAKDGGGYLWIPQGGEDGEQTLKLGFVGQKDDETGVMAIANDYTNNTTNTTDPDRIKI